MQQFKFKFGSIYINATAILKPIQISLEFILSRIIPSRFPGCDANSRIQQNFNVSIFSKVIASAINVRPSLFFLVSFPSYNALDAYADASCSSFSTSFNFLIAPSTFTFHFCYLSIIHSKIQI